LREEAHREPGELLGRLGYQLAPIEKQRMPKQTERTAA